MAETINKINARAFKIVLVVPTDKIALHANLDFPYGTAVFIAGYNSIVPKHGYMNSALGIAKLLAWKHPEFRSKVQEIFEQTREEKPLVKSTKIVDGKIPDPRKI